MNRKLLNFYELKNLLSCVLWSFMLLSIMGAGKNEKPEAPRPPLAQRSSGDERQYQPPKYHSYKRRSSVYYRTENTYIRELLSQKSDKLDLKERSQKLMAFIEKAQVKDLLILSRIIKHPFILSEARFFALNKEVELVKTVDSQGKLNIMLQRFGVYESLSKDAYKVVKRIDKIWQMCRGEPDPFNLPFIDPDDEHFIEEIPLLRDNLKEDIRLFAEIEKASTEKELADIENISSVVRAKKDRQIIFFDQIRICTFNENEREDLFGLIKEEFPSAHARLKKRYTHNKEICSMINLIELKLTLGYNKEIKEASYDHLVELLKDPRLSSLQKKQIRKALNEFKLFETRIHRVRTLRDYKHFKDPFSEICECCLSGQIIYHLLAPKVALKLDELLSPFLQQVKEVDTVAKIQDALWALAQMPKDFKEILEDVKEFLKFYKKVLQQRASLEEVAGVLLSLNGYKNLRLKDQVMSSILDKFTETSLNLKLKLQKEYDRLLNKEVSEIFSLLRMVKEADTVAKIHGTQRQIQESTNFVKSIMAKFDSIVEIKEAMLTKKANTKIIKKAIKKINDLLTVSDDKECCPDEDWWDNDLETTKVWSSLIAQLEEFLQAIRSDFHQEYQKFTR